jgi:hypothetical protein
VASAKLANRGQQRKVVAADVVLRHVDDGAIERLLTVVVAGVFGDVAGQLGDLDLARQVALETREKNLALKNERRYNTRYLCELKKTCVSASSFAKKSFA